MKEHVEFAYANTYRIVRDRDSSDREYVRGIFYNFLKQSLPKTFNFYSKNRSFYRHTFFFVNTLYIKEYTVVNGKQLFFKVAFDPSIIEHWEKYKHVSEEGKRLIDALNNFTDFDVEVAKVKQDSIKEHRYCDNILSIPPAETYIKKSNITIKNLLNK